MGVLNADKKGYQASTIGNELDRAGVTYAFDQLYQDYYKLVHRICLRMLRDPSEAEDVTQDAFLRVFLKLHTFRGESAPSSWLYRLATNLVLMHFRKNTRKQISLDDWVDKRTGLCIELGGPDLELNGVLHRIDLQAALDQLPEGYRTAFVLYDIQGFDHKEIAQMFGHSVGSSKSQLHKARRRLRELLSGHFSEPARQNPTTKVFKRSMSNVRNIGEQNSAI